MHPRKKLKFDSDHKLDANQLFNTWYQSVGIKINNAIILRSLYSSGNGLFATENIRIGELIFSIPKSILLTQSSLDISNLVEEECSNVKNKWIPLLIGTIYEYCLKEKSKWFPYFNLTINLDELDLPIFWDRNEIDDLLTCTGLASSVINDLNKIERDYNEIVKPFIDKYTHKFKGTKIDLHFYKIIVAFVMAYSFTLPNDESQCPILVPLADILNHVTSNNAKLVFGDEKLSMVAVQDIKKGEEIFNTYGELSNSSLLHMYGFAENLSDGKFDSVDLPLSIFYEEITNKKNDNFQCTNESIKSVDCFNRNTVLILLQHGIADKEFVINILKKFAKFSSNTSDMNHDVKSNVESDCSEGLDDDDDDDDDDDILTFDQISNLDSKLKEILLRLAEYVIKQYPNSIAQEESILSSFNKERDSIFKEKLKADAEFGKNKIIEYNRNDENVSGFEFTKQLKRKYYAACVRRGQLCLLIKLKSFLS